MAMAVAKSESQSPHRPGCFKNLPCCFKKLPAAAWWREGAAAPGEWEGRSRRRVGQGREGPGPRGRSPLMSDMRVLGCTLAALGHLREAGLGLLLHPFSPCCPFLLGLAAAPFSLAAESGVYGGGAPLCAAAPLAGQGCVRLGAPGFLGLCEEGSSAGASRCCPCPCPAAAVILHQRSEYLR